VRVKGLDGGVRLIRARADKVEEAPGDADSHQACMADSITQPYRINVASRLE
jgi:hypothetical protein